MFHDLLGVEMAAEVHRRQVALEEFQNLIAVFDHAFFHVDTAQALEIVVPYRDHGDSLGVRLLQAFFHPLERALFDLAVDLVFRLTNCRVQHHEPGGVIQFHQITQGIRCLALCLVVTKIRIDLAEFFRCHALHVVSLVPKVFSGVRFVDIMVAGDHIDRNSRVLDLPELLGKFQVVCLFAV